jgi:hypothetical protein
MEQNFLRCPNCGSVNFYVQDTQDRLIFFNVNADGEPVSVKPPDAVLTPGMLSQIYCTSCPWYGSISELKP